MEVVYNKIIQLASKFATLMTDHILITLRHSYNLLYTAIAKMPLLTLAELQLQQPIAGLGNRRGRERAFLSCRLSTHSPLNNTDCSPLSSARGSYMLEYCHTLNSVQNSFQKFEPFQQQRGGFERIFKTNFVVPMRLEFVGLTRRVRLVLTFHFEGRTVKNYKNYKNYMF